MDALMAFCESHDKVGDSPKSHADITADAFPEDNLPVTHLTAGQRHNG